MQKAKVGGELYRIASLCCAVPPVGGSGVSGDVFHCSAGGFSHGLGLALLLRIFHYEEPQVFKKIEKKTYCDRYLDLSRPKADKCHEKKPFKLLEKKAIF